MPDNNTTVRQGNKKRHCDGAESSDSKGLVVIDEAIQVMSTAIVHSRVWIATSNFCRTLTNNCYSLLAMTSAKVIVILLAITFFTITPALSAFRCVECPENFFCKNGQKTACPASTPVTNGTQKSSESDCMTCYQKTGNSSTAGFKDGICTDCYTADSTKPAWNGSSCTTCLAAEGATKPVYSDLAGRCVSCGEKDSSTPNWNGTACVGCSGDTPYFNPSTLACEACPADKPNWDGTQCVTCEDGYYEEEITCADGTEWNEETQQCEETIPEGAIVIPTDTGSYYLTENTIFRSQISSKAECEAMINDDKYPEVTGCNYPDEYWAKAVKICRDQGKRLPTIEELTYLAQEIYGNTSIAIDGETNNLNIGNQKLFDLLAAATNSSSYNIFSFWTSEQYNKGYSYYRTFYETSTLSTYGDRGEGAYAFCVPQ